MEKREKHLYYLTELGDYKIASKDPDVRGWDVKDRDNTIIGKVDNLLVNKELGKVVYLDVEVEESIIDVNHDPYSVDNSTGFKEFINKEGENHIIIPIGLVDLNLDHKFIHTDSLDYRTFAETKRYRTGDHITRDYERNVLSSYNRDRNRDRNYDDVKTTRSAYSNDEVIEDDYTARDRRDSREERAYDNRTENNDDRISHERKNLPEDRSHESRTEDIEDRMAREKANMSYKSEAFHDLDKNRNESTEERMERERAQLRSTSRDAREKREKRPVTEISETTRVERKYDDDYRPERTYDEDSNWKREDQNLTDEEIKARNRRLREEDEFYNQSEFQRRNRY